MTNTELVARGAALLDAQRPDWWTEIDLGTLNLGDAYDCILGQLYGRYWEGLDSLFPEDSDIHLDSVGHGFASTQDTDVVVDFNNTADQLTMEWTWLIDQRRINSSITFANVVPSAEPLFEGTVTINGNKISLPPVSLDYLNRFVEANK